MTGSAANRVCMPGSRAPGIIRRREVVSYAQRAWPSCRRRTAIIVETIQIDGGGLFHATFNRRLGWHV
jgi:hypothetical protein